MKRILKLFLSTIPFPIPEDEILYLAGNYEGPLNLQVFSTVLKDLEVQNLLVDLEKNDLYKIPKFSLLEIKSIFGLKYVFFESIVDHKITYRDHNNVLKTSTLHDFSTRWTGLALLTEQAQLPPHTVELRLNRHLRNLLIIIGVGCLSSIVINTPLEMLALLSIKMLGVALSIVLLMKVSGLLEIPKLDNICEKGTKRSCDDVLISTSKISFFKFISIPGFCLIYFLFGFITMTIDDGHTVMSVLKVLNGFSLIAGIFSIYYQWRIIKQWCLLCLLVSALLCIEFLLFLQFPVNFTDTISWRLMLFTSFVCFLIYTTFDLFKNNTYLNQREDKINSVFKKKEVIKALLEKAPYVDVPPSLNLIALNKTESENTLVIISDPECASCVYKHQEIDELLNSPLSQIIKFELLLVSRNNSIEKESCIKIIVDSYIKGNPHVNAMITDLFTLGKNHKKWLKKYSKSTPIEFDQSVEFRVAEYYEFAENNISGTPTVLFNGSTIPSYINIKNIVSLLEEEESLSEIER